MAFDFPNAPTIGATYTVGSKTYLWDGEKWLLKPAAAISTPKTAQARNLITNPTMWISQENGNTEASINGYFMADQWWGSNTSTGTMLGGRDNIPTPRGSPSRLHARVTVADAAMAAAEYTQPFLQLIEGTKLPDLKLGTPQAIPALARFGFKAPAGTYCMNLREPTGAYSCVLPFTIATPNVDTEVILPVPPCTIGTWSLSAVKSMSFNICVATGGNYQAPVAGAWTAGNFLGVAGMSNGMATVGNRFELFDVGLYADPDNTGVPPPWVAPDYVLMLNECQRYWLQRAVVVESGAEAVSTTLPTGMRTQPTISGGGAGFSILLGYSDIPYFYQTTRASQTLTFNARM